MAEGAPGATISALDWAKLAVDLYNSPNTAQLAHYVAAQIEAAGAQFNFYQDTRFTVPRGSTLRFWMANVDDSVTLRCLGLVESLGSGQTTQWLYPVQQPGPGLIIAELGNSGGYNTSLSLHVGISTGPNTDQRFVQMDFKDADPPLTQHKRNFIFRFAVA